MLALTDFASAGVGAVIAPENAIKIVKIAARAICVFLLNLLTTVSIGFFFLLLGNI